MTPVRSIILIVLGAILVTAWTGIYFVHQTQQALVLQFGEPVRVVTEPGLRFKIPFVQQVILLDNRILDLDAPAEEVIASDQKRLVVDTFARFRISDPLKFYQTVGNESVARSRMGSVINSNLRQVLGSETFESVLSRERQVLMERIRDSVNTVAADFGITVVDVRIKRADLPQENSLAIYRRMQTERQREAREARAQGAEEALRIRSKADRDKTVLLAEAKRDSEIIRGEGEGESTRIFAEAFGKDIEFFSFYRSMNAYREVLNDEDTTLVLSPDSDFLRFLKEQSGSRN